MTRRQCCFLSMDSLDGYVSDDELAIPALNDLGWDVSTVSWRDESIDWNNFEITVIRTTWDYQRYPDEFLATLGAIENSDSQLENPVEIVKWNLDKRYLRELEAKGTPTVPTLWGQAYDKGSFNTWLEDLATDEIIIKPTISATAEHTYRLRGFDPDLGPIFAGRPFMVQPFLPAIESEGEYSLFYFNGEFSHAILKTPKDQDFRVQEEHGGIITPVSATNDLIDIGSRVMRDVVPVPLYGRVDLVRDFNDSWLIMELELIEPALYFRMDPDSPERFARALTKRMDRNRK